MRKNNSSTAKNGKPLENTERLYNALVNTIPAGIIIIDNNGKYVYSNQKAAEITGYSIDEIVSGALTAQKDSIFKSLCQSFLDEPVSGNDYFLAFTRKDGRAIWLAFIWNPVTDDDGKIEGMLVSFVDITVPKQAEQALRDEKNFSDAIIESLPGSFFVLDQEGNFIRWNKNQELATGYTTEEYAHLNALDVMAGEDREASLNAMREVFENGSAVMEAKGLTKDGKQDPFLLTGVRADIGGKAYLVGMAFNIAERVKAEEELRKTTAELQAIILSFPDLYFVIDADNRIVDYKAGSNQYLYAPPSVFIGRTFPEVLPADVAQLLGKTVAESRGSKNLTSCEYSLPISGVDEEFEARCSPHINDQVFVVVRKITDRKKAEEALRESEAKYKSIVENSSDIISLYKLDGSYHYISPACEHILGYTATELLGKEGSFIHPEDMPIARDSYQLAVAG